MDRIEAVREYVDQILLNVPDNFARSCGYIHLYGVAQACAMIALKRGENVELAVIAGMLHDIYSYSTMDVADHARRSAVMAKDILCRLGIFSEPEMEMICGAIYCHSDKDVVHTPFVEVLIDADVMQHCLYNPLLDAAGHEKVRFEALKKEFSLIQN